MKRVSVVGNSGSGKTYFAKLLAQKMECKHIELDAIFHQENWTSLGEAEFREAVTKATESVSWVIDGNYRTVRDIVWSKADTVIFLDVGFIKNTFRVVKRSLFRSVMKAELWNGNKEKMRNLFSFDPKKSIIAWSISNYKEIKDDMTKSLQCNEYENLKFVVLKTRLDQAQFLKANLSISGSKSTEQNFWFGQELRD